MEGAGNLADLKRLQKKEREIVDKIVTKTDEMLIQDTASKPLLVDMLTQ